MDNAVSPMVADALRAAGHDAVHVREYGIQRAPDSQVLARAAEEGRTLISADTDFGTLAAFGSQGLPSVILFRRDVAKRPKQQAELLLINLPNLVARLEEGSVVVFDRNRVRVRPLPIRGQPASWLSVSLHLHRPQVAVQPRQDFLDHLGAGPYYVPRIEQREPLVLFGGAQQAQHGHL